MVAEEFVSQQETEMIKLDGINLYTVQHFSRVTINGAHISGMHVKSGPTDVRSSADMVEGGKWYDDDHQRVMKAVRELEAAMAELLSKIPV